MTINTVTVLGANGTMGRNVAAIFASFGNAKVYMVSRNIEKSQNAIEKAYESVKAESIKAKMIAEDYDNLERCVCDSDLVFEACAEDLSIKTDIHSKVSKIVSKNMLKDIVLCSGTSGLSITSLAELYDEPYRECFVGMHFFNPPYNMTLCELIPTNYTDKSVFGEIRRYLDKTLYRTTVEVRDFPAFLGNRIGFQFINEAMQLAEKYKYNGGIDYIDAILGSFTGRNMAPLATANFVGLDVHKAIVDNIYENTNDYAHETFVVPSYAVQMVEEGKLGKKSGIGLYKTVLHADGRKEHQVFDIDQKVYREVIKYNFPFVDEAITALKVGNYSRAMEVIVNNHSNEAELCCQMLLKYVVYSVKAALEVGFDIHSADDVMATGFGWCPPLAIVEAFGGKDSFVALCKDRLDLDTTMIDDLEKEIIQSKYDYRRYLKAKH